MKSILISAIFLVVNVTYAQSINTPTDAFNVGKALANKEKVNAESKVNEATGKTELPNFSTNAPETAHFKGGRNLIDQLGKEKLAHCQTTQAATGFLQQECDAVNFMSQNPTTRAKYSVDKKEDPLFKNYKEITDASKSNPDTQTFLGKASNQCRVERVTNPATTITETCTETQALDQSSCKRTLNIACDPEKDGCDQGGIVPNSWAGDMTTSLTADGKGNHILQFGTIADNYWTGWGAVFDRTLTFDIRDVNLITRFALTKVAFDDWMKVEVNGHLIYVGPYGGDRLEIYQAPFKDMPVGFHCEEKTFFPASKRWRCYDSTQSTKEENYIYSHCQLKRKGTSGRMSRWLRTLYECQLPEEKEGLVQYGENDFKSPELTTSWNFDVNIDIKRYLKEGTNTIAVRTIVAGAGEGDVQFTTRQLCPRNCVDQWDNSQCALLEQRAK